MGFGQWLKNYLPRDCYTSVFRPAFGGKMGFVAEHLVCPVRAEDILQGPHPDYVLTPVEFYRDIVAMTALKPVFIGQTKPNAYIDRIRTAFPDAIYREPQEDSLVYFETIRQSHHAVYWGFDLFVDRFLAFGEPRKHLFGRRRAVEPDAESKRRSNSLRRSPI
jgi:hypothetical protein